VTDNGLEDEQPEMEIAACPACGARMSLTGIVPRFGGLPELRTFRCGHCGETETYEEVSGSARLRPEID
jgi:hypothetical protein